MPILLGYRVCQCFGLKNMLVFLSYLDFTPIFLAYLDLCALRVLANNK